MKKKIIITVGVIVALSIISFTVVSLNDQTKSDGGYIPIVEKGSLFFWIE